GHALMPTPGRPAQGGSRGPGTADGLTCSPCCQAPGWLRPATRSPSWGSPTRWPRHGCSAGCEAEHVIEAIPRERPTSRTASDPARQEVLVPFHPQVQAIHDRLEEENVPNLYTLPIEQARAVDVRGAIATAGDLEAVHEVRDLTIPGPSGPLPARMYRP